MTAPARQVLIAIALLVGAQSAYAQKPFEVEDLLRIDRVENVVISPGGEQVAVVTERPTAESYFARSSKLWLVDTRGGKPRRAVDDASEKRQSRPSWSPDGKRLAYFAQTQQGSRLRLLQLSDSAVTTLSACAEKERVATVTWSPDGSQLAAICERATERDAKIPKIIVVKNSETIGDPMSALVKERRLVLVDVAHGTARELAKDNTFLGAEGAIVWTQPQSIWIVGTPPDDYAGSEFVEGRRAHRFDIATNTLATLPDVWQGARGLIPSPDGANFMLSTDGGVVGADDWKQTWRMTPYTLRRIDHAGRLLSTSPPLEIYVTRSSRHVWTSTPDRQGDGVVYFNWFDQGSGRVKAYYPARQRWSDITPPGLNIDTFSVSADGRKMAVVQGDANVSADVYLLDLQRPSAKPVRLTRFGDAVRDVYSVAPVERLQWRSSDDRFDIDGWLVKPPNFKKGQRYPLIVDVHGGPGVTFRNRFETFHFEGAHMVPPDLYAAKGYMVLMVNPRGDPGYGRAHQEALLEGWEYPTRYDIFSGVDHVIELGYADPERLGISGASYGGWVTAFAVSQTDRFKAASANDPVIDSNVSSAIAYRGKRVSNFWLHAGFAGGLIGDVTFPTVDPKPVKTPILLRFGLREEAPYPSEFFVSGVEYFSYLHSHCRPVAMIMHPEEGHGIGDYETWRDYVVRDLEWFDYFIKAEGTNPLADSPCTG